MKNAFAKTQSAGENAARRKVALLGLLILGAAALAIASYSQRIDWSMSYSDLYTYDPWDETFLRDRMDVVFTWVNGSDSVWAEEKKQWQTKELGEDGNAASDSAKKNRFQDSDELRYSLRAVEMNMPWMRNVIVVTSGQVPVWLNTTHPKVRVVKHSDFFYNTSHLPSYNSAAIETNLHRIDGLSEDYLYLNDDFFILKPINFYHLFFERGLPRLNFNWVAPECEKGCNDVDIGDGICNEECMTDFCLWDKGDCDGVPGMERRNVTKSSFIGSLIFSNNLLNERFGVPDDKRRVPEHMPYIINRSKMAELQALYPMEYNATSSHRFRHQHDIQYTFMYYHYMLNTNMDRYETYDYMKKPDAHFVSMSGNLDKLEKDLARAEGRTFLCVNNDLNGPSEPVIDRITRFYRDHFPNPSSFELNET